jgi:8-oxo-dGTP pyrophosphatase MutT (NUDIX family)
MNRVRQAFEPSIRRAFHLYWRWARGVTLGVRGLVIDKDQRIFLVTHTYAPGWQLPGGGVEPGETMAEALARELVEEGNIEILEPPVLHGLFFNSRVSQRDHVALFIVRSFRQQRVPVPNQHAYAGAANPGELFVPALQHSSSISVTISLNFASLEGIKRPRC